MRRSRDFGEQSGRAKVVFVFVAGGDFISALGAAAERTPRRWLLPVVSIGVAAWIEQLLVPTWRRMHLLQAARCVGGEPNFLRNVSIGSGGIRLVVFNDGDGLPFCRYARTEERLQL